ncbi:MAG: hypothetical protein ACREUF_15440 [Solimonas sp.]
MALRSPLAVVLHRGVPVVYRRIDEWLPTAGGRHARSGRSVIEAHELGCQQLLDLTPELVATIEADERRMAAKGGEG